MKFYVLKGKAINKDEFVEMYSQNYYLGNERIKGITQNSPFNEKKIDSILKNGIKNEMDVIHILAWKIGKIKHKECTQENPFVYSSDWENVEKYIVKRYGKDFNIKDFVQYIARNIDELEKKAPQDILNILREKSCDGIGTVYLITLLYFISKGKYPIYDRFAAMALYAINNGVSIGETVEYRELPEKNSKKFDNIMDNQMKEYIDLIESIFGKEYQTNRDIDRALWVYGHLFKVKKDKN